jgi:MFS family permease
VDTSTLVTLAFSATAGVLVEFYDFFIYGYAAASAFPSTFFPNLAPTQALVFSYLAFGAAFPARILGAFIFGHFGDRVGRKYTFLHEAAKKGGSFSRMRAHVRAAFVRALITSVVLAVGALLDVLLVMKVEK